MGIRIVVGGGCAKTQRGALLALVMGNNTVGYALGKHPALGYRTLQQEAIAPISYYHLMNPKQ